MASKVVDRDKTRRINSLILNGINEIRGNKEKENMLKDFMTEYGILGGEVRNVLLTQNIDEIKFSLKYMILNSFYKMTNDKIYDLNLFHNSSIKLKFLHKYPSNTQIPYARIFEKSKKYEENKDYSKDLSEFTLYQLENFLGELEPLTESASHVNGRIVTAYIDWCIENKETSVIKNELKEKDMDYFKKFVDKKIEIYFTKAKIDDIVDYCVNYQDAVIIKLLFLGIQGKSLAEIRNIKKEHLQEAENNNNLLTVYDEDGTCRKVRLDEHTMFLLKRAVDENEYEKRNGDIEDESVGRYTNLVQNDFVIRTSITKTDFANRPVEKMVIYRRIKTISEVMETPHLTAKNIVRSGIMYEASRKMKNKELTKDDYLSICAMYNIDNWYPVKQYCNPELIMKLYPNIQNNVITV